MIRDFKAATREAQALKAAGRLEESIALNRRIVAAFPQNNIARHNLAAVLGEAARWTEAEPHIRAALKLDDKPAETWLLAARAAQAAGRLDEADSAFVETIQRKPLAAAHRELAQLRWMREGDIVAALTALEAAPPSADLAIIKAQALLEAGQAHAAHAFIAPIAARNGADTHFNIISAQVALAAGDLPAALAAAKAGVLTAPKAAAAHATLVEALLAAGDLDPADAAADTYRRVAPLDQHAIALQATVWRAQGDPRYRALYDYDAFVHTDMILPPAPHSSREAYLDELREALLPAHHYQTHPFAQSVRHGSQAPNVLSIDHPATRALPAALAAPIARYLAVLGDGADPLRVRNTRAHAFQGMWSIRLKAGGGHIPHVHPQGWISAVLYIDVTSGDSAQGAIAFGEPGLRLAKPLGAERFHTPMPGELILFPSYMWHAVLPFEGKGMRLTIAFDLIPG